LQNVHHGLDWVSILLHRCSSSSLDRYVANVVQTARQRMTASSRWLQQPFSSTHRRE
jgi:hypothetical protein